MKVEEEAPPIHEVFSQLPSPGSSPPAAKQPYPSDYHEEKVQQFQVEKDTYVEAGKALMFESYVLCNDQQYAVKLYYMLRKKKSKSSVPKRIVTRDKTTQ